MHHSTEICSVCQSQPEDMLILTCQHNLCLQCATQVYNINMKQDVLVCQICLGETKLDSDTVVCLRSLAGKAWTQANNNIKKVNVPTNRTLNFGNNNNIKHQPFQIITNLRHNPSHPICSSHSQPLSYFCFNCNSYSICSQCILSSTHFQHKIYTLKKSKNIIKQNIQKICNQKLKLKQLLQKDKENLINRKDESEKQMEQNLKYLQGCFSQIIVIVQNRYEQMKQKIQKQSSRKLQIMSGAINEINQKIQLIQQTIIFEQQLLQSTTLQQSSTNPFHIFEYYTNQLTQPYNINFQPNLPNFIPQICQEQLNKQYYLREIKDIVGGIEFVKTGEEKVNGDDNINCMSYIDGGNNQYHYHDRQYQENYVANLKDITLEQYYNGNNHENHKDNQNYNNIKKQQQQVKQKRPVSENINIIQSQKSQNSNNNIIHSQKSQNPNNNNNYSNSKYTQPIITNNNNIIPNPSAKPNKQTLQTLKRRARENLKNKQLANSRKLQLSRSLINANDILNKIQQRSMKI